MSARRSIPPAKIGPSASPRERAGVRERREDLVVFLGPSLAADEARTLAPCTLLPPAKAGDVFAVLPRRPLAIALVDGVFEGSPSVWHHELLAALDAGIAVYGGGSMGALRAAELSPLGVVGVGTVFGWYRDGAIADDDEVAVYHAPAERGSRPYTVPLVDVRWAIVLAARQDLLHPPAARAILAAAQALHFGDRTWERIFETARLPERDRLRLAPFFRTAPSLKAQDARATIRSAAEWVAARRAGAPPPAPALPPLPSHARRRRLEEATTVLPGGAATLGEEGLRRALLAAFARSLGLRADAARVAAEEREWLASAGRRARAEALAAAGLDDGAARALFEDLALESLLLAHAQAVVPDGPARDEGLALAARLNGAWRDAAEATAAAPSPSPSRPRRGAARASRPASPAASAPASPGRAPRPRGRGAPTGASPRRPPSRRRGR